MTIVHRQGVQHVTARGDRACTAVVRRVHPGEPDGGEPRCTGNGRSDSRTSPHAGNGVRRDGDRLIRSHVGAVRVVLQRPALGTPTTVTRTRARTGTWDAGVSCAVAAGRLPVSNAGVGVDGGLASVAPRSTGKAIANPRCGRPATGADGAGCGHNRAARGCNPTPAQALAHSHARSANRRADVAHKRSRDLVDRAQVIVCAHRAPLAMGHTRGMRTSMLDVAWRQCISMTVATAAAAGRPVVLVNPRDTSTLCSSCGERVQKTLRDRTHTCPHCGLVLGRDHTAALTMLQRGEVSTPFACKSTSVGRHTQKPKPSGLGAVTEA